VAPSDLSESLIDAAAPKVWAVTEAETPEQVDGLARSAVVAVLETLATHTAPPAPDGPVRVQFLNHEEFKRLAAEVREGTP
jgi:hypothetical protein